MIGHLTYTDGAPCPTLVLDARELPREPSALLNELTAIRRWLSAAGHAQVLKIALVEPSTSPMFDLDYRFVQAWPDDPGRFDLRGSCGHSILGSIMASQKLGMTPEIASGLRTRVNVLNNGDRVICEVEDAGHGKAAFEVRFRFTPPKAPRGLLLTGEPRTVLEVDGRQAAVSLVSVGNPYVFVAASSVGASTVDELFGGGQELLDRLVRIRSAAAGLLGWPADGAFPKVAAILPAGNGGVAVRAVSVPSWHPTLALTGSVCLAAATKVAQTIPWLATQASDGSPADPRRGGEAGHVTYLHSPTGRWPVSITTAMRGETAEIAEVSVGHRLVTSLGSLRIDLLTRWPDTEVTGWLQRTA